MARLKFPPYTSLELPKPAFFPGVRAEFIFHGVSPAPPLRISVYEDTASSILYPDTTLDGGMLLCANYYDKSGKITGDRPFYTTEPPTGYGYDNNGFRLYSKTEDYYGQDYSYAVDIDSQLLHERCILYSSQNKKDSSLHYATVYKFDTAGLLISFSRAVKEMYGIRKHTAEFYYSGERIIGYTHQSNYVNKNGDIYNDKHVARYFYTGSHLDSQIINEIKNDEVLTRQRKFFNKQGLLEMSVHNTDTVHHRYVYY